MTVLALRAAPPGRTVLGVLCGAGAGALWGLVFLAPVLAGTFTPLQLTIGRYLAYGLAAALLLAPRWHRVRPALVAADWRAAAWLGFTGNTLYYVLLALAVQSGGIALTSLVIGFLPVAVTMLGRRDAGAVALRRLAPSLLLCAAAALCVGWQALQTAGGSLLGLLCAVGALAAWTLFAVGNSRCLARLDRVSAHEWSLLVGVATGAQALLLVPVSLFVDRWDHPAHDWFVLAAVSTAVALFASILGNALWNRMSRLLPLTLVGQMILFETLFALAYGLLWEARWPTLTEGLAFVLIVAGVASCLAAHRPRGA